eukprot:gnl/TRDRNA2_/TRDRNA2_30600_c0_seq1.p1 gnl/TRDRNA2_/TRDRNA2_30600_c0~~gnl/TRDRNA2_/TRDRNA2_30600_c0_seq1.p1  ORF type:complete len:175 (-),score=28.89 gnl/TRDRNA2_/TRDRNA2_30600_c0_seq1:105-629(-)
MSDRDAYPSMTPMDMDSLPGREWCADNQYQRPSTLPPPLPPGCESQADMLGDRALYNWGALRNRAAIENYELIKLQKRAAKKAGKTGKYVPPPPPGFPALPDGPFSARIEEIQLPNPRSVGTLRHVSWNRRKGHRWTAPDMDHPEDPHQYEASDDEDDDGGGKKDEDDWPCVVQ